MLQAQNDGAAGLDDAGFFNCDLFDGVAEIPTSSTRLST
jgi:hypothetical protein